MACTLVITCVTCDACQNCLGSCMNSCQTCGTCQQVCQSCNSCNGCQSTCELACQTVCQSTCQSQHVHDYSTISYIYIDTINHTKRATCACTGYVDVTEAHVYGPEYETAGKIYQQCVCGSTIYIRDHNHIYKDNGYTYIDTNNHKNSKICSCNSVSETIEAHTFGLEYYDDLRIWKYCGLCKTAVYVRDYVPFIWTFAKNSGASFKLQAGEWLSFINHVNLKLYGKNGTTIDLTAASKTGMYVYASDVNKVLTALRTIGCQNVPADVGRDVKITAAFLNQIAKSMNDY